MLNKGEVRPLQLCKSCTEKLDAQPVDNGVMLALPVEEIREQCRKQNDI